MYCSRAVLVSSLLGAVLAGAIPKRPSKRDSNATVNPPAAVGSINNQDGIGAGSNNYANYNGNGTPSQGWPSKSQWVSFEDMFNNNKNSMFASCAQYGVANDSGEEVGDIYNAIQDIAARSGVDHRFILAIMMNESSGCVRVPTTRSGSIYNPGLMQDFDGYYSCNYNQNDEYGRSGIVNPCPQDSITNMVREGAVGTDNGDGLATLINNAQNQGASDAQTFYVAARWYNSGEGSVGVGGDLSLGGGNAYARNVANRLTGWTN